MFFKIIVSLLVTAIATAPLCAKELNQQLDKTAQKLSASAVSQNLGSYTLAVFPYQADEKLSKKKVNVAVSEILTNNLLKQGTFKLTERARLEEVMKEQKLGLSGAVDSKTAAELGKLMGAKLLVLGNVIQVGNSYQVTSKLVNSESGEILASEIFEVPVKTFDEDAERYLVLVPETQAIGVYLAMGYAPVTVKKAPAHTAGGATFTPGNGTSSLDFVSIGARYFFSPKWMADVCVGVGSGFESDKPLFTLAKSGVSTKEDGSLLNGNSMIRLSLNRAAALSGKFRLHAGAGYMFFTARSKDEPNKKEAGTAWAKSLAKEGVTYFTPFLRLGLEWRPQTRLGISLFGIYNTTKKDYKGYAETPVDPRVLTQQFAFPQVMAESTVSLYF